MSKETLAEIDKQIVAWIEQLDELYAEQARVSARIQAIEGRLSSMKQARRALAAEWGETSEEVPIPLKYTAEGVTNAIKEVLANSEKGMTVSEIAAKLVFLGFNFGGKSARRVINMALINDRELEWDGKGGYTYEELPW